MLTTDVKFSALQHGIKKIRNGLHLSRLETGTRQLKWKGYDILWQQFTAAYHWDVHQNSVRFYHKLSDEHLFPDNSAKMRNHLAEECLNQDMLRLFQEYEGSIPGGRPHLNGVIELLKQTSQLITIFRDKYPIRSPDDERLKQLKHILDWFKEWEAMEQNSPHHLLSHECRKDLASSILGFIAFVTNVLRDFPDAEITPAMANTDLLENTFGCHRGLVAGLGTNPTVLQYSHSINTIALATNTCSVPSKSNAGKSRTALPFQFPAKAEVLSVIKK